jgi:hypothetical protein
MRLTLRTMLAYLDNVLEPAETATLGKKIEESEFATGLMHRIKGVMKKLRMDAPKVDGKGVGNDANTVAEYLDSSLPQDRVAEFERVCLESDKHLCEVASCHQVLTLVLGNPADVRQELRDRIYALGDPNRAPMHPAGEVVATAVGDEVVPPPPPGADGRPAEAKSLPEVPEYLRAGRDSSIWTYVGIAIAALLLGAVALFLAAPQLRNLLHRGGEEIAQNDKTEASGTNAVVTPDTGAKTHENESAAALTSPTTQTEPETSAAATAATTTPTDSSEKVAAATPQPMPVIPAIPDSPETTPVTPPAVAPVAVLPKLPKTKAPAAAPRAAPIEVGRYASDREVLATLDAENNLWYSKRTPEVLVAGERLIVLPPYRPLVVLPSAVQLTFAGEGGFTMQQADQNNVPRLTIDYGRFLLMTAGRPGAQVSLELAGIKGVVTLEDADSTLAIKVGRWVPPGIDPEPVGGLPVIEMYNNNGRASWQQVDQSKVEIPPKHVHVYVGDEPPETHGPFQSPEWIEPRSVKAIDRAAAPVLQQIADVDPDRPLNVTLQEATKDRRVEVRALAARCLAAIGEFEPILRELGDPNQSSYWQGEFDALRQALNRSPETATKVREALGLVRAGDAKELYRLLWGFSEEQLQKGDAAQLVRYLDSDQMDIRVLAHLNLIAITGASGFYRPERPPAQMKTPISVWKERLNKGTISYNARADKMPPSPLDVYKPIAPVAGEGKAAAAAPGDKAGGAAK